MDRTRWVERKFSFDLQEGLLLNILERLNGTEARIRALGFNLSDEQLMYTSNDSWSIKEEIGHLTDLDDLHILRIEELIARKSNLSSADMSNTKTDEAHHYSKGFEVLIKEFGTKRKRLIDLLPNLDDQTQLFKSMHPRLQILMRPIDIALFAAEHDDHHLASIREKLEVIRAN